MTTKKEEETGTSTPAEDIVGEVAEGLGADDGADTKAETPAEESAPAKAAEAPAKVAEPVKKAEPAKAEPAKADDSKKGSKKAKADEAPKKVTPSPADENRQAIAVVFSGGGDETKPGDYTKSPAYSPDEFDPIHLHKTSPKVLGITLGAIALVAGIGYGVMPSTMKQDFAAFMSGIDVQAQRAAREEARLEAERQAFLEGLPKYGDLEIVTDPASLMVNFPGQALLAMSSVPGVAVPTRTRFVFSNIAVDQALSFTILGEGNLEDKAVSLAPFDRANSADPTGWSQRADGTYSARQIFQVCWPNDPPAQDPTWCLTPRGDEIFAGIPRWQELRWRVEQWRPADPPPEGQDGFLHGSIEVTTNPPGALIAYNRTQLLNADGSPMTTPATFSTYPAPEREGSGAVPGEPVPPLNVRLLREGVPLQVFPENETLAAAATRVFMYQYVCEPVAGAAPVAPPAEGTGVDGLPLLPDFTGTCNYVYRVHFDLIEKPAEGSGEGSGEGTGDGSGTPG